MGGLNLAAGLLPGALTAAQTYKDYRQYQAEQDYQKAKYQQQQEKSQRDYQEQLARQQYELQKQAIEAQNDRAKAFLEQQKAQQDAVKEQNRLNAEYQQQQYNRTKLGYTQQQDLAQLIQRQDADLAAAQQDAASRRQQIDLDAANTEAARQAALRRAVARQRATFGARGISPDSGSAEAVLLGLYNESEDDRLQREKLDRLRQNALTDDLNQKRQRNLLERTQLAEAQKLQMMTYLG